MIQLVRVALVLAVVLSSSLSLAAASCSLRTLQENQSWTTNYDLFVAPIDGTVSSVNVTAESEAWDCAPAFSTGS